MAPRKHKKSTQQPHLKDFQEIHKKSFGAWNQELSRWVSRHDLYMFQGPKDSKNMPNIQPNQKHKNIPKMTTKITQKKKFGGGKG